jgi:very-short-patch-repair endonuclease
MTEFFNRKNEKEKRRVLRNEPTQAETLLWNLLKNKQVGGYKFRRQYSVEPYIIDFYCPSLKLAIEVDGPIHQVNDQPEYDRERQQYIETFGIQFLRFTNEEVYRNIDLVLNVIAQTTVLRSTEPSTD